MINKYEVQAATATNIEGDIEAALLAAEREVHQIEGATKALPQAGKAVLTLHGAIDRDIEQGVLGPEYGAIAKRYVTLASELVYRTAKEAEARYHRKVGRCEGLRFAHDRAQKTRKSSEEYALLTPEEIDALKHPGPSLKTIRNQEEQEAAAQAQKPVRAKKKAAKKKRSSKVRKDAA